MGKRQIRLFSPNNLWSNGLRYNVARFEVDSCQMAFAVLSFVCWLERNRLLVEASTQT